jgi:hypothetical protein
MMQQINSDPIQWNITTIYQMWGCTQTITKECMGNLSVQELLTTTKVKQWREWPNPSLPPKSKNICKLMIANHKAKKWR